MEQKNVVWITIFRNAERHFNVLYVNNDMNLIPHAQDRQFWQNLLWKHCFQLLQVYK